jgi:hypothetical protein
MKKLLLLAFTLFFTSPLTAQDSLPDQVDLSATKYFPPIHDQGYIGSCDWFAVVYYQMTFLYNKLYDRTAGLDNTFSPKFGYNILNNGAVYPYNIRVDDVYKFSSKHGSATMADFPYDLNYQAWCTDSTIWKSALNYRIEGFSHFTYNDTDPAADSSFPNYASYLHEIKRLLYSGEVLVIQSNTFSGSQYTAIDDDTNTHADDPYVGEQIIYSGNNGPDHTVALVGYDDNIWTDLNDDGIVQSNEKGALKIADSYAVTSSTHNHGFLWMAYSTFGESIWLNRVNRMKIRNSYKPEILCKLTLNSAARDMIRFQFGRCISTNSKDISVINAVFDPYGLGYESGTSGVSLIAGGNFAFDGSFTAGDGSFTFDLTSIYKENSQDYWYLRIDNSGVDTCMIKGFEITDTRTGSTVQDTGLPHAIVKEEVYRFLAPPSGSMIKPRANAMDGGRGFRGFLNPVYSDCILYANRDLAGGSVKIVAQNGQILFTYNNLSTSKTIIPLRALSSGSYIVLFYDKNGTLRHNTVLVKM